MATTAALAPRGPRIVAWSRMGDEALAGRAAAGSEAAFTALYERYHDPLLNYCRSILLDAEDAHDAAQSALEKALRALPRREADRPLKPWLYRIAHNEAIDVVRRRQPVATGIDTDDLLSVPGPEVASEQRTRLAQLVDDLRMLPERQRGALVMRELSGLSYDEIGLALGISGEAARRAVFDARSALHDAVDGRATACVNVRRCLSDGDRRRLRARGMRAHLRACDDCATFERAIGARQTDLHLLGSWIGGAGALGIVGVGAASGGAATLASGSILAAASSGGGAAALGGGSVGWGGLPVAMKGLAVAAVVATTGTAAVELPKVTRDAAPAPSSARAAAPAISALHHPAREQAIAEAARAAAQRARAARADARVRTGTGPSRGVAIADGGTAKARAITPVAPAPAAPAPAATQPVAHDPAPTLTPTPAAISEIGRIRDRILAAFNDAQTIAATGTQAGLATANALVQSTLASVGPLLDEVLATFGLTLPSNLAPPPPPSSSSSGQTATNVMAPVQSLLSGVDGLLQSLFGRR
ncbi:MAG: RNA polymerase sigma factor [Solirubrobacteraceae bacterium]|nr:RNA polymerase sigma factor [Solirubrobacteraceae bacterium]